MKIPVLNIIVFLVFSEFSIFTFGQVNPGNNLFFSQEEIATIKINLLQTDLDFILAEENEYSDVDFPATFIYETNLLSDTINNVGFRLRGNTSRSAAKKSFKVEFNSFIVGQKYYGIEKMNLNGEHNDVSIMRSKLSHEILTNANLCSPRSSYIKLYINSEYKGLYLNVEHIDEEYIQKRFPGNDSGNLFKCSWGANLTYLGANKNEYKTNYELKTNELVDDYSSLIHFIDVLNNAPESNFACDIEAVFDVDSYLKTAAYEILIGHWDGYIFNNNNFYLYQKPLDGKFIFLEFDEDNTFGIDWFGIDWSTRDIYSWNSSEARPLFTRLISIPYYKERFTIYMEEYLNSTFSAQNLISRLTEIQNFIQDAALMDTYKDLDYGFTNADFLNSISVAWGGHVTQSLSEYITNRSNSAQNQLSHQLVDDPCLLSVNEIISLNTNKFCIKTIDLLGKEINFDSKNNLKIKIYSDGSTQKIFELNEIN